MLKFYFALPFCFFHLWSYSQVKIDSSFTVYSEYQKNIKKYPNIKIVKPSPFSNVKEIKEIPYKKLTDKKLFLDAFLFQSKEKLPAVILIHGGGWKSGNKKMQEPLAQNIARKGYQTFTVEYRLSDEAKYPASIEDVTDAIQFLKKNAKKYNLDTHKIAILGCSSGGQMAALIGEKNTKEIKAIIDIDGILVFHHLESKEANAAEFWLGGSYKEIPEVWEDASALSHISKKAPPILFINSQFDRFHAGRDDAIQKLNTFGIYSKIEKIENSPHAFWLFDPWFQPTLKYVIQFLNLTFKKNTP